VDESKTDRGGFQKGAVPLEQALELALTTKNQLLDWAEKVEIVGSVRRMKPVVGDIDLLIYPVHQKSFLKALQSEGYKGDSRVMRKMVDGILVEIYIAHRMKEFGALTLYLTGDRDFVYGVRAHARTLGFELSPYGLFERRTQKLLLESPYEGVFFDVLVLPETPPEERYVKETEGPSLGNGHLPPKEWSPYWKRVTSGGPSREMFHGVLWDFRPWRAPDVQSGNRSIWYGPDGKDGTEATVLMYQDGGWAFGEFTGVAGVIDNPPEPILSTWTFVTFEELARAVREKAMIEIPTTYFSRNPHAWGPYAAAVGSVKISNSGGQEEWTSTLP
jgi:hypothetical protein